MKKALAVMGVVSVLAGCNLLHRDKGGDAGELIGTAPTSLTETASSAASAVASAASSAGAAAGSAIASAPASGDKGDEASARALLTKFLAPSADRAALSKPLRPTKADYAALFDAPTAAKLQPQYDEHWDKEPMVLEPKPGQTEVKLWAATSEDLQAGKGNANEFPGGWKKVAPHLTAHKTWYRFKFVKPGEDLGMAFDGLTFVNGHWVMCPKPWHGL